MLHFLSRLLLFRPRLLLFLHLLFSLGLNCSSPASTGFCRPQLLLYLPLLLLFRPQLLLCHSACLLLLIALLSTLPASILLLFRPQLLLFSLLLLLDHLSLLLIFLPLLLLLLHLLSSPGHNCYIWRARVCRPLLRLCRSFMIFEECLYSNPEHTAVASWRATDLATHPST